MKTTAGVESQEIWVKVDNYRYCAIVDAAGDCFFYEEGQKKNSASIYSIALPVFFSRLSIQNQKEFIREILLACLYGIKEGHQRERNNLRKYLSDNE